MSEIGAKRPGRPPAWRSWRRFTALGLLVLAVLAVLALAVRYLGPPESPSSQIARRLAGERWYATMFRHRPVGHYHATTGRTPNGDFEFRTELRFRLAGNIETRMADTLVFHRRPPHPLLRATHASFSGEALLTGVEIADGVATVYDGLDQRRIEVEMDLPLDDYLAIERWLAEATPQVGDTHWARAVDFDRLAVVSDRWRILARDADGVEISKESYADSTFVRIDNKFVPQRMQIGALFTLELVRDEGTAKLWERESAVFSRTRDIAVDRLITRPNALARLVVAVKHSAEIAPAWMAALPSSLTGDNRVPHTTQPDEVTRATDVTVNYPADDPTLKAMAHHAVAGLADQGEQARALGGFVHSHLRYRDTDHAGSVHDTMRSRTGDCTEFADFYTTLARALGLPARTVIGLAYRAGAGDGPGAFALHAWNEVAVDGLWHSIDPAWGQDTADVTHLTLPEESALAFIAELPNLRLSVVETVY